MKTIWRERLNTDQIKRWEKFVAGSDSGHYQQSWTWEEMHASGYTPRYFWMERDGDIVGAGLVHVAATALPNKTVMRVLSGPVCDDVDLMSAVLDELGRTCAQQGGMRLEVNPQHLLGSGVEALLVEKGYTPRDSEYVPTSLYVDLTPEPAEIFASLRRTLRQEINKFSRRGGEIRYATTKEDLESFFTIFRATSYHPEYALYFEKAQLAWDAWLADGASGILLLTYYHDIPTAGVFVLKMGNKAYYTLGALLKHERGMPHIHRLLWEAMLWAKRQGCTIFDLGEWRANVEPTAPLYGVYLFKAGFSRQVVQFVRPHRKVLQPLSYWVWMGMSQLKAKIQGPRRGFGFPE